MKNKTSKIFVAFSMFGLLLTGCSNLLPNQPSRRSHSVQDSQVEDEFTVKTREIYNLYLAQGGTLTYEEWLESIRGEDGKDGQTPRIGTNGNWWIGSTDTGVKAAGQDGKNGSNGADGKDGKNGADGKDGKDGADGKDGQTPYIGENGNWWIGTTDTGVAAKGDKGDQGVSITSTVINSEGELIITFSDGSQVNAGKLTFTEHVHEYTSEIVNPTCTTDGIVTFTCKTCGHVETVINKAQGHVYEAWREAVAPTCDSTGLKIRYCMYCGERQEEVVAKHDHTIATYYMKNAATHWRYCQDCGVVIEEQNHTFVDDTCSICGFVKKDASVDSGLIYSLNSDGESYTLADLGTCKDTEIIIPETYNGKPVTAIGNSAFTASTITSITMPNTITKIGDNAFEKCEFLANVVFSKGLKEIGRYAFMQCAFEEINLPEGLVTIDYSAFYSCRCLKSAVIPSTVENIGGYAFGYINTLKNLTIKEGCTHIGWYSFVGCQIESIVIPASIKTIEGRAFESTSLNSAIFIDPNNWYIGNDTSPIAKEILEDQLIAARKLKGMSDSSWYHRTDN